MKLKMIKHSRKISPLQMYETEYFKIHLGWLGLADFIHVGNFTSIQNIHDIPVIIFCGKSIIFFDQSSSETKTIGI